MCLSRLRPLATLLEGRGLKPSHRGLERDPPAFGGRGGSQEDCFPPTSLDGNVGATGRVRQPPIWLPAPPQFLEPPLLGMICYLYLRSGCGHVIEISCWPCLSRVFILCNSNMFPSGRWSSGCLLLAPSRVSLSIPKPSLGAHWFSLHPLSPLQPGQLPWDSSFSAPVYQPLPTQCPTTPHHRPHLPLSTCIQPP